jgi:hypothetical protein
VFLYRFAWMTTLPPKIGRISSATQSTPPSLGARVCLASSPLLVNRFWMRLELRRCQFQQIRPVIYRAGGVGGGHETAHRCTGAPLICCGGVSQETNVELRHLAELMVAGFVAVSHDRPLAERLQVRHHLLLNVHEGWATAVILRSRQLTLCERSAAAPPCQYWKAVALRREMVAALYLHRLDSYSCGEDETALLPANIGQRPRWQRAVIHL